MLTRLQSLLALSGILIAVAWLAGFQVPDPATNVRINTPPIIVTLTNLNPNTGAVGASVILTGTGFGSVKGGSSVAFNGTVATTTAWANTSITATVPTGATTGSVIVQVAGVSSNTQTFTVTVSGGADPTNWCAVACFYVRPNGTTYGTGSGANWTNAYSGFSSVPWASVPCGATVWVAGGTYTQPLKPVKSCTSTTVLNINRARSDTTSATGAAGWTGTFDATVRQPGEQSIQFQGPPNSAWIKISGRKVYTESTFPLTMAKIDADNGWFLDVTGSLSFAGTIRFYNGDGSSNITFEYIDIQGPGEVNYTTGQTGGRGVMDVSFSHSTGHVYRHMHVWNVESCFYTVGTDNLIFEYMHEGQCMPLNWPEYHPNGIYINDANGGIVRHSYFSDRQGEGVVFSDGGPWNNWQIYDNVFFNMQNGVSQKAISAQDSPVGNLRIYNNSFWNNDFNMSFSASSCSGGETRNNLYFGAGSTITCGTTSNGITASTDPFVNKAANNFNILATISATMPRDKGTNLGAPWNIDLNGCTRGTDGTWDVGAVEFNSVQGTCGP